MVRGEVRSKVAIQHGPATNPGDCQAPDKKALKKVTGKRRRIEKKLVDLFHAHWLSVSRKIGDGNDVASARARFIFARNERERMRLARRWYSPARALRLSTAATDEVLGLSSVWLDKFCDYADGWLTEPKAIRKELSGLIAAEYVALVPPRIDHGPMGNLTTVHPLPDESIAYGNVYEITASGLSCGANMSICKSVGEPFLGSERLGAIVGIEREFFKYARVDGESENEWRIDFDEATDPRVIRVGVVMNEED